MLLKTQRLVLRPQLPADVYALFNILSDSQAMRFWGRPAIADLAAAELLVEEQQAAMASRLCRYWTMLEGRDAIGSIDLSLIEGGSADLGFMLRPDRRDKGLASEAVTAVIAHAWGPLGLTRLAAAVQAENRAAARVLEKNGFAQVQQRAVTLPSGENRVCGFYLLKR
jgi:[ribosomal protein S5]-alanine N-acetyltransferase